MQGLAKSIAWDGEGATVLIEVSSISLTHSIISAFWHKFEWELSSRIFNNVILSISHLQSLQVAVNGASSETEAAKIARSVAGSSLVKAWSCSFILNHLPQPTLCKSIFHHYVFMLLQSAIYGRDPNWGRIAAAAGYAGVPFEQKKLKVSLGNILLMDGGEPQSFDRFRDKIFTHFSSVAWLFVVSSITKSKYITLLGVFGEWGWNGVN